MIRIQKPDKRRLFELQADKHTCVLFKLNSPLLFVQQELGCRAANQRAGGQSQPNQLKMETLHQDVFSVILHDIFTFVELNVNKKTNKGENQQKKKARNHSKLPLGPD